MNEWLNWRSMRSGSKKGHDRKQGEVRVHGCKRVSDSLDQLGRNGEGNCRRNTAADRLRMLRIPSLQYRALPLPTLQQGQPVDWCCQGLLALCPWLNLAMPSHWRRRWVKAWMKGSFLHYYGPCSENPCNSTPIVTLRQSELLP